MWNTNCLCHIHTQIHRDTEKVDGMFGTLVIQLPSDYSGGELIVKHRGEEKVFSFSGLQGSTNFHIAAFYADCQHEIKKVTAGYRLCLVYNLLYKGSKSFLVPPDNSLLVNRVVAAVKQWNADAEGPPVLAYILEHMYTETSLSFKSLKNLDRAVGDLLVSARNEIGFDLYLAHVNLEQDWGASNAYCSESDYELSHEKFTFSNLVMPSGQKADFSDINFKSEALMPKNRLHLDSPDERHENGDTGNEGACIEKTYRMCCLLLWPVKRRIAVLRLHYMTEKLNAMIADPLMLENKTACVELAQDLVEHSSEIGTESAVTLFHCLVTLKEDKLLMSFLATGCGNCFYDDDFCSQLFSVSDTIGWQSIEQCLLALMKQRGTASKCCIAISKLCALPGSEPIALGRKVAKVFVESGYSPSVDASITLLKCLKEFNEFELTSQFLLSNAPRHYHFINDKIFTALLIEIGRDMSWKVLEPFLLAVFQKEMNESRLISYCEFLSDLVPFNKILSITTEQRDVCLQLLMTIIRKVYSECYLRSWTLSHVHNRKEFLLNLLKLCVTLNCEMQSLMKAVLHETNLYPLATVIVPALQEIHSLVSDEGLVHVSQLVSFGVSELRSIEDHYWYHTMSRDKAIEVLSGLCNTELPAPKRHKP